MKSADNFGKSVCLQTVWVAILVAFVLTAGTPALATKNSPFVKGPARIVLGDKLASIDLPEGYEFVSRDKAIEFRKQRGESTDGLLGMVVPLNGDGTLAIDCLYDELGFVGDFEELNADDILKSLKEGVEIQNKESNGTFALFESESESIDLVKPLSVGSDQSVLSLRAYT